MPKGSSSVLNNKQQDPELIKVVLNQLSILTGTLTESNWETNFRQVRYILHTNNYPVVVNYYFEKLLNSAVLSNTGKGHLSFLEQLFEEELNYVSRDLENFEILYHQLKRVKQAFGFNTIEFLDKFNCDILLSLFLVSTLEDDKTKFFREYIRSKSGEFLTAIRTRTFPPSYRWSLLLDFILSSSNFSLVEKVLIIGSLPELDKETEPFITFHQRIIDMSFKDLLTEIGPENLLPDRLLPYFLQLRPNEINQSIALILAEVIVPGSQNLAGNEGQPTILTSATSMHESYSKGTQLQGCLRSVDSDTKMSVDWAMVFSYVEENLQASAERRQGPTAASITQLFSALDFKQGPIDIFLSIEWWFSKSLFYILYTMDPQQGAFDICSLKNISPCYRENEQLEKTPKRANDNGSRNILRFANIAKLELLVVLDASNNSQISQRSESDQKLNQFLLEVFEYDCRNSPEYLIIAASLIPNKNVLIIDLIGTLFGLILDSKYFVATEMISELREVDFYLAINVLLDYFIRRGSSQAAGKVCSLSESVNLFEEVFSRLWSLDVNLSLALLVEALNNGIDKKSIIETKLQDNKQKGIIYLALLELLETRAAQDFEASQQPQALSASLLYMKIPVVFYLLEKFKYAKGVINAERLKNLQVLLLTTYPRLINFGCGHDQAILANAEQSFVFSSEVEHEMKSHYSKMYNKEVEIKDIVDMLARMKVSDAPHDQDVFACMIHSLLDEYRFFPEYPLSALASTSLLFGALLQRDLIQGTTLTVALNFIWESCNQPQDSHLFKFAIQSLYNFKTRLHEYPMYCKHLLECQSLSAHARMYQIVKDAANGIPCPDSNVLINPAPEVPTSVAVPKTNDIKVRYLSLGSIPDQIGFVRQETPPENVSGRLLFFVNNMTEENLVSRLPEVKDLLTENYFLWFARYIVSERAKVEPNNHHLYSNLIRLFDDRILYEYVLAITLNAVESFLIYAKESSTERSHLKNLGAWLGKITLAIDRPIRRDYISLKGLLLEAFHFEMLHLAIPFVCKTLEQAQYSKIFSYPNPWLLGILKVLVELYECVESKLSLKFEIEVLLNSLKVSIRDIEPSTLVRSSGMSSSGIMSLLGIRPPAELATDMANLKLGSLEFAKEPNAIQLQHQLQQPQMQTQQQATQQPAHTPMPYSNADGMVVNSERGVNAGVSNPEIQNEGPSPVSQLDTTFSSLAGNTIFTQNPNLRRAFQASLSRAVRECTVPILGRVSEVVLTTVEALVKKDFACEADVGRLRKSYLNLALKLSHSMVLCSGRKILSETIEATMLQILGNQLSPNELPLAELILAVQANVGLCVDIVDRLVLSNMGELIDERMKKYVEMRENHNSKEPYVEEGAPEYSLKLPQPLGLMQSGLTATQLRVYENFGSNDLNAGMSASQGHLREVNNIAAGSPVANPAINAAQESAQKNAVQMKQDGLSLSIDQLFLAFTQNCEAAIHILANIKETKLSELPNDHHIIIYLSNALSIAQSNALKFPELVLRAAQYVVNCLFTQAHENPMANEIYVVVLDKLCEYSPSTAKDVTWWLVHSTDQRKFNLPVIYALLKVQLIQPIMLDATMSKLIKYKNNPVVVRFAANLLQVILASNELRPISVRSDFGMTLEALEQYQADASSEPHQVAKVARDDLFHLLKMTVYPFASSTKIEHDIYSHMGYIFSEWIKVVHHGQSGDLKPRFIKSLLDSHILTDPKYFEVFFRAAIEISVILFATEHEIRAGTQRESLLTADCLAILIVEIILNFDRDKSTEALDYFKKIVSILVMVLSNDHENSKAGWNERAYFRIFSSILCVWADASKFDSEATAHLDEMFLVYLGDILNSLNPIVYPGFTFAWVSLIGHRMLLPKLLGFADKRGYPVVVKLFTGLLKFVSTYSKDEAVHDIINVIYKGISRLFAGVLHDYPEFFVECHYQLVTEIPPSYVQLRNIVLSAIPPNVSVVDPFTQGLKVERLKEIHESPVILSNPVADLDKAGLKKPVENYLRMPSSASMRSIISNSKLSNPRNVSHFGFNVIHYNIKAINALVLHIGMADVAERVANSVRGFNTKSNQVALLVDLMNHGTHEFRFHLINAICNQLRYPNSHTHWFIGIILHFFSSNSIWSSPAVKTAVQELITRVLLERHIVNKPHPWGLTIVFTELVKNGDYGFFDLPFIKNTSPDMKLIFESLARNVKGAIAVSNNYKPMQEPLST